MNPKGVPAPAPGPTYKKGQSGNPSGKPKNARGFRARCRSGAIAAAEALAFRVKHHGKDMPTEDLIAAMAALGAHGGMLTVDKMIDAQVKVAEVILKSQGAPGLHDDVRMKMLTAMREEAATAFGDDKSDDPIDHYEIPDELGPGLGPDPGAEEPPE